MWSRYVAYLSIALLLAITSGANAGTLVLTTCRCGKPGTLEQEFDRAFAVFTGKIVKVDNLWYKEREYYEDRARFQVYQSWKGVRDEEVVVRSELPANSANYECHANFRKGAEYLIFSYRAKLRHGPAYVSPCKGMVSLDYADDAIKALGIPENSYKQREVLPEPYDPTFIEALPDVTELLAVGPLPKLGD